VDDVDLEVVLLAIEAVLAGAVHVQMIHIVVEWALSMEVCDLNPTEVSSLELYHLAVSFLLNRVIIF
jgi:hypothetical protein